MKPGSNTGSLEWVVIPIKPGEKKGELNTGALEWLVIPGKP